MKGICNTSLESLQLQITPHQRAEDDPGAAPVEFHWACSRCTSDSHPSLGDISRFKNMACKDCHRRRGIPIRVLVLGLAHLQLPLAAAAEATVLRPAVALLGIPSSPLPESSLVSKTLKGCSNLSFRCDSGVPLEESGACIG